MNQQHSHDGRYKRQLQLPGFGSEAQQKLLAAKVLVVGAGGLGVPVLQYLTGMGVGTIGIVDDDVVSLENLHRQVLYTNDDIGLPKVRVAAAKLRAQNPEISIRAFEEQLRPDKALRLVADYDVVVDATDNFAARYLINDACVIENRPFVYGAVHQYEGHVSVFNYQDGPTYRCLHPSPPLSSEIPDCNMAGVLGVVPGLIGCRQALEVVKIITGIGKNLSGFLLVTDFLNDEQRRVKLKCNPQNKTLAVLQASYEPAACLASATTMQPSELQEWYDGDRPFLLLDVREPDEYLRGHLPGAENLPLSRLAGNLSKLQDHCPLVLYCQKGSRSARASAILMQQLPARRIFNLAGGLDNWVDQSPHS